MPELGFELCVESMAVFVEKTKSSPALVLHQAEPGKQNEGNVSIFIPFQ